MVSITQKIKEWRSTALKFEVMEWDNDFDSHLHFNMTFDDLHNIDGNNVFVRTDSCHSLEWLHRSLIELTPISEWRLIDSLRSDYWRYCEANDLNLNGGILKPEIRLLCNLKFRGMTKAGEALFSDRTNFSKRLDYSISQVMLPNRCAVFELDISEMAARNYFYNADDRTLVYKGSPSWVKN